MAACTLHLPSLGIAKATLAFVAVENQLRKTFIRWALIAMMVTSCRALSLECAVTQETGGAGLPIITLDQFDWPVSGLTVMNLATVAAMCSGHNGLDLLQTIAAAYKVAATDTTERSLDSVCTQSLWQMKSDGSDWDRLQYHPTQIGSSPACRTCCIGLRYPAEENFSDLVGLAVETCRITHHHPTAILGAVTTAACTAWAVRNIPPRRWGLMVLTEVVPATRAYIEQAGVAVQENLSNMGEFISTWEQYLELRNLPRPGELTRGGLPMTRGDPFRDMISGHAG